MRMFVEVPYIIKSSVPLVVSIEEHAFGGAGAVVSLRFLIAIHHETERHKEYHVTQHVHQGAFHLTLHEQTPPCLEDGSSRRRVVQAGGEMRCHGFGPG